MLEYTAGKASVKKASSRCTKLLFLNFQLILFFSSLSMAAFELCYPSLLWLQKNFLYSMFLNLLMAVGHNKRQMLRYSTKTS